MERLRRKRAVIRSAVTRATNELEALLDSSDATAGELTESLNILVLKEAALKAVDGEIEDGVDIGHLEEEMESVEAYQVSVCRLRTRATLKLDALHTPNIASNALERLQDRDQGHLRRLYDDITINVRSLEALGVKAEEYSVLLHAAVKKRLPDDLVLRYCQQRATDIADSTGRHMTCLCDPDLNPTKDSPHSSSQPGTSEVSVTSAVSNSVETVLLQTATIWAEGETKRRLFRCLLDGGSQRTFGFKRDIDIDILIGADNYWKAVTGSIKRLAGDLTAVETIFGWTLQGPVRPLPEVGWHQAPVMQVMTRHQSNQPSQQLRETNTLPVPEEDVPEPKQSSIKSELVPEEAVRKDSDLESDETEALKWAPYTVLTPRNSPSNSRKYGFKDDREAAGAQLLLENVGCQRELSASDSKEDSGIPHGNVMSNHEREMKRLRLAGEDVDAVAGKAIRCLIEKSVEGSSGLLGEKISTETLRHPLQTFRENNDYRYQDFVSDEAGLNLSALFEQPLVEMQDIAIKKQRRGSSDHGSTQDNQEAAEMFYSRSRETNAHSEPAAQDVGIQVGDVVLLRNHHRPRTFWDPAVVDKTFPGRDGKVCVSTIRLGRGTGQAGRRQAQLQPQHSQE
ncbi:hypothetical protein HPB47_016440 [Ixodes persulcatus]|uniref:Uncharacterized protein n=1 Tax=Ixodes persulcatus TaxID=34615 RepID=A0AC60QTD7_IXOPE|nr:hypothetical protein HPB47_016440 [Ixodes persulcatus]